MAHAEYNDDILTHEAVALPEPWEKRGITEEEYDQLLADKLGLKNAARLVEIRKVIPSLIRLKQNNLAQWILWQYKLDWNSYDLTNGLRAARLLIAKQHRQAWEIMRGITGIDVLDPPESSGNSVHPTPFQPQGNVKYTGDMRLELDGAPLLKSIGSKHKQKKSRR